MDHKFVWNTRSFLEASDENSNLLLREALQGLIAVPSEGDTAALFFEGSESLLTRKISPGRKVQDFLDYLQANNDVDLVVAFMEIEDKADAVSQLTDDAVLKLAEQSFYFSDLGYSGSVDCLALAVHVDGVLFGVQSNDFWRSRELQYSVHPPPEHNAEPLVIFSVACLGDGEALKAEYLQSLGEVELSELLPTCSISERLADWIKEITPENRAIVRRKLQLAYRRSFQGGEPLFKTLNDAEGMREIRFDAMSGGAVRILFGALPDGTYALLVGWIKKAKSEGYEENINAALPLWKAFKAEREE